MERKSRIERLIGWMRRRPSPQSKEADQLLDLLIKMAWLKGVPGATDEEELATVCAGMAVRWIAEQLSESERT
jgi:hypothetical protein